MLLGYFDCLILRYNTCHKSNLNGFNLNTDGVKWGITWNSWKGDRHSLAEAEMAVYPNDTTKEVISGIKLYTKIHFLETI